MGFPGLRGLLSSSPFTIGFRYFQEVGNQTLIARSISGIGQNALPFRKPQDLVGGEQRHLLKRFVVAGRSTGVLTRTVARGLGAHNDFLLPVALAVALGRPDITGIEQHVGRASRRDRVPQLLPVGFVELVEGLNPQNETAASRTVLVDPLHQTIELN